ncbi:translational machinery component [Pyrenochaeta sp. DS3sAY3a]|nr:translational machinery component [Pyrenochaeta sp. DS3sAY3a]
MASNSALRTFRSLTSTICSSCRSSTRQSLRPFTQSAQQSFATPPPHRRAKVSDEKKLDSVMAAVDASWRAASPEVFRTMIPGTDGNEMRNLTIKDWDVDDRHKLHIYAHRHNTHLTLTKPNRDALISISCGNIGFRKAGRGSYDAAYQLTAFLMSRIVDKGLLPQIQKLELVYRGFGPGREAVTKAILGAEGKRVRPLIVKLSDSTRLKFGGVRSKKPRRLG